MRKVIEFVFLCAATYAAAIYIYKFHSPYTAIKRARPFANQKLNKK